MDIKPIMTAVPISVFITRLDTLQARQRVGKIGGKSETRGSGRREEDSQLSSCMVQV